MSDPNLAFWTIAPGHGELRPASLRPPAADLLFRRGLRDPLLISRDLRPHWAAWLRAATTYSHVAGIHIQNPPKSMRRLKGLR